ncbi:hypothetical protein BKA56DRAFT_593458 [Ilyonectria sp. MPI-CAGE-AT-0026]|nr:hypothetical protein BKA56DRAFT_593458 [Ilyonectria sp. MPI-CAGE-AT-0026]
MAGRRCLCLALLGLRRMHVLGLVSPGPSGRLCIAALPLRHFGPLALSSRPFASSLCSTHKYPLTQQTQTWTFTCTAQSETLRK